LKNFRVENLDIPTLFTLERECGDRIKKAQQEIELCSILLKSFGEEIQVRKNEYEMDRDL